MISPTQQILRVPETRQAPVPADLICGSTTDAADRLTRHGFPHVYMVLSRDTTEMSWKGGCVEVRANAVAVVRCDRFAWLGWPLPRLPFPLDRFPHRPRSGIRPRDLDQPTTPAFPLQCFRMLSFVLEALRSDL